MTRSGLDALADVLFGIQRSIDRWLGAQAFAVRVHERLAKLEIASVAFAEGVADARRGVHVAEPPIDRAYVVLTERALAELALLPPTPAAKEGRVAS